MAVASVNRLKAISVAIKARAVKLAGRMSPKSAVAILVMLKYKNEKSWDHKLSPTSPLKLVREKPVEEKIVCGKKQDD